MLKCKKVGSMNKEVYAQPAKKERLLRKQRARSKPVLRQTIIKSRECAKHKLFLSISYK